ncbi:hypothetical protein MRB53_008017 [Persea americana]|uniref:Uncharacterized protein n=1 Tax=Persea americana TaxID=3435 RepID=A0ACC2MKJ5_PERAE|nr:hypothetical protein MRB53_008017 [Persea americana]
MASVPHPSFLLSLNSLNGISSSKTPVSSLAIPTNPRTRPIKISASLNESKPLDPSERTSSDGEDPPANSDPVKLAFAKAIEYKKSKQPNADLSQNPVSKPAEIEKGSGGSGSDVAGGEVPPSVKLAMEKAREYKKNKGNIGGKENIAAKKEDPGLEVMKVGNLKDRVVEKRVDKKEEPTISSVDFLGLGFSDKKKTKGMPAGLVPLVDPFPDDDLPEVELIVGDTSKFGTTTSPQPVSVEEDADSDLYKPKVSTWGVFPRPSNISKTFGGGRVIQPGEVLETAEDKAAKEARTRQLLAAYKNKMGITINPKTKSECEKALKDGDSLMDLGRLQEAVPYYEKVMKELVFQSELHGLAALQWSICQDSLTRTNEARVMYEKLQSHPNVEVSKKARQFMFGFKAMEMMKVSSYSPTTTGYQNYFEAFVEDKANYSPTVAEENEDSLKQALPYIVFLISPIFLILFIAARKVF